MSNSSHNTNSTQDISGPIAWSLSVGAHIGIGLVAFFITWSVIRDEEDPPRAVTATWHEQPIVEEAKIFALSEVVEKEPEQREPEKIVARQKPEPARDGLAVLHEIATTGNVPKKATREPETEVKFMGLDAVAARRIVYVVDASGSMMLHLSTVLEELERSLRKLHPKQMFGIVFFQNKKSIAVPPKGKLVYANAANIEKAMRWIGTSGKAIPTGGSNPIVAIKTAMRLEPEVMYLLSENITGAGSYEVPQEELLEAINGLNPVDTRNGLRKVQINCIQYLSEDVNGTMEKIAKIHGGDDGYVCIERGKVVK
jgi:hypothetical protein